MDTFLLSFPIHTTRQFPLVLRVHALTFSVATGAKFQINVTLVYPLHSAYQRPAEINAAWHVNQAVHAKIESIGQDNSYRWLCRRRPPVASQAHLSTL